MIPEKVKNIAKFHFYDPERGITGFSHDFVLLRRLTAIFLSLLFFFAKTYVEHRHRKKVI